MKRTPLTIIFLVIFIDLLGFGIVIPILPGYAQRGFGADDLTVGLIIASYSLMQFFFTPLFGKISDRLGRRPVILCGLTASVAGYILFGLADSLPVLFISRFLGGIGGANISAAQAYIADVTPANQRAKGMGLIGAAFGLGFLFGPLLGGLLSPYGYHVPGFAAAGLSAAALLFAVFLLPEPAREIEQNRGNQRIIPTADDLRFILKHRPIRGLTGLYFLIIFSAANLYATFPIYGAKDFHLTDREVGFLFGTIGLFGAMMQGGVIRHAVRYISERKVFLAGHVIMLTGLLALALSPSVPMLFVASAVYAIGINANMPTGLSLLSQYTDPSRQGMVLGINQSLSSFARVVGPINGGFVYQHVGHTWPFLTGSLVMLIASILTIVLFSQSPPAEEAFLYSDTQFGSRLP